MKNQKMKLSDLKIKSFVTRLSDNSKKTVHGGYLSLEQYGCDTNSIEEPTNNPDICNTMSVEVRCAGNTSDTRCADNNTQQNSLNNCTNEC